MASSSHTQHAHQLSNGFSGQQWVIANICQVVCATIPNHVNGYTDSKRYFRLEHAKEFLLI